jgi:hypothetical protein
VATDDQSVASEAVADSQDNAASDDATTSEA